MAIFAQLTLLVFVVILGARLILFPLEALEQLRVPVWLLALGALGLFSWILGDEDHE